MATQTFKMKGIDSSAHCRDCGYSDCGRADDSKAVTSRARYHVNKTGHSVEVYREHGVLIKRI